VTIVAPPIDLKPAFALLAGKHASRCIGSSYRAQGTGSQLLFFHRIACPHSLLKGRYRILEIVHS